MDPEARRRACVAFRDKLGRDTGATLTAAACAGLLGSTFQCQGEAVSLQSNPGLFYVCLGEAIADQRIALVLPDRLQVAWWCYREAAEVLKHPVGMRRLAWCLMFGLGVTKDPTQAAVWYQKAADLGDAPSKGCFARAWIKTFWGY